MDKAHVYKSLTKSKHQQNLVSRWSLSLAPSFQPSHSPRDNNTRERALSPSLLPPIRVRINQRDPEKSKERTTTPRKPQRGCCTSARAREKERDDVELARPLKEKKAETDHRNDVETDQEDSPSTRDIVPIQRHKDWREEKVRRVSSRTKNEPRPKTRTRGKRED